MQRLLTLLVASILLLSTVSSETVTDDKAPSIDKTQAAFDECEEFPNIAVVPFTRYGLYLIAWKHGGHVYWKVHTLSPNMRLGLSDLRELTSPPMSTLVTHTLETLKTKHSLSDASSIHSLSVLEHNVRISAPVELTGTHKAMELAFVHPPVYTQGKNMTFIWQLSSPVLDETDWYSINQDTLVSAIESKAFEFWNFACTHEHLRDYCRTWDEQVTAFDALWPY